MFGQTASNKEREPNHRPGIFARVFDWFRFRQPNKRVGLALGVFDFCHDGHVNVLRRAAAACDLLVVGVHTDENVVGYKGLRPANSQLERLRAIEQLGIADRAVIFTDRRRICQQYNVDVVFHGDDCEPAQYREMWGEDLIAELNIDIELLPHTPGVSSGEMRDEIAPIGWWLQHPNPAWSRAHIFDHIKDLYRELGGVWFVSQRGRDLVREHFPSAPCVLVNESLAIEKASEALSDYKLDVVVTATNDYNEMRPTLRSLGRPINLVVLSHGRSGKKGGCADISRALGAQGEAVLDGSLVIHDWSCDPDCYTHLDRFLQNGGTFKNPIPDQERPRILILPTWGLGKNGAQLLKHEVWAEAFAKLSDRCELILAPHPLADRNKIDQFVRTSGATLLETTGHSFEEVPTANCVVCDMSGVFWEALLFDTPVVLAVSGSGCIWPDDVVPTSAATASVVPFVQASEIESSIMSLLKKRAPRQAEIAAMRLGNVDGKASARVAKRIRQLLEETGP